MRKKHSRFSEEDRISGKNTVVSVKRIEYLFFVLIISQA